jgi:hypothetical protein
MASPNPNQPRPAQTAQPTSQPTSQPTLPAPAAARPLPTTHVEDETPLLPVIPDEVPATPR